MIKKNQCRLRAIQGYLELKDCNSREKYVELMKAYGIVVGPSKVGELLIIIQRISLSNARELFKFRKMIVPLLVCPLNLTLSYNIAPSFRWLRNCSNDRLPEPKVARIKSEKIIILFFQEELLSRTGDILLLSKTKVLKSGYWRETLENYASYLTVLYHNTFHAKSFAWSGSILEDIDKLYQLFGVLDDKHNIVDRLVNMFCHFAGFKTLNDIDMYLNSRMFRIDKKNREIASHKFLLEKGDFIKGIYKSAFRGILQNGCVSNPCIQLRK